MSCQRHTGASIFPERTGGWVGPTVHLEVLEKSKICCLHGNSNPEPSTAYPKSLHRLRNPGSPVINGAINNCGCKRRWTLSESTVLHKCVKCSPELYPFISECCSFLWRYGSIQPKACLFGVISLRNVPWIDLLASHLPTQEIKPRRQLSLRVEFRQLIRVSELQNIHLGQRTHFARHIYPPFKKNGSLRTPNLTFKKYYILHT